jgi:hypothetical protein
LVDAFTEGQVAIDLLEEVSREFQSRGWRFNTVLDVTLALSSGTIAVSSNVLDAWPYLLERTAPEREQSWVLRGTQLFNLEDNSTTFTEAQRANIIYMIDWHDLNEPAKRYVTIRAARKFQQDMIGAREKDGFNEEAELQALRDFRRSERRSTQPNSFRNNIRMAQLLGRRGPRSY